MRDELRENGAMRTPLANSVLAKTVLANVALYLYMLPGTVILGLLAVLVSWIPPRGHGMLICARVWSRCLLAAGGLRLEVEVDPAWKEAFEDTEEGKGGNGSSCVFMANHGSYLDVPALLAVLPGQVRFAAKRTLFLIPIFGWSLWAGGFIPIDRKNRSRAKEAFEIAARRIRGGASVLFFPEGTRSHDGRLGELERGGFLLALKSGVPIVPVGIDGSYRALPRNRWTVRPGTIHMRLGAPVPTEGLGVRDRAELMDRVRERITELSEDAGSIAA